MSSSFPKYIQDRLKKVALEQGFTPEVYRLEVDTGDNKGDGFIGDIFKATIREDGKADLVLIGKTLPNNEARRQYSIDLFHREVEAYNRILPTLNKFQLDKGLQQGSSKGFWSYPKTYYAHCNPTKMEGVVIMEDLREKSFRMCNKLEPVGYQQTKLLMIELGKLHAVSFALKAEAPELFEPFKQYSDPFLNLVAYDPTQSIAKMMNGTCEMLVKMLESTDKATTEKLNGIRGKIHELYQEDVKIDEAEPYAVLAHGDCWINNMLYRYGKDGSTFEDICLIDWQLCRYVSPILDLVYFIFLSTDEELRAKHYDEFLDIYYKSLGEALKNFGESVERHFPREAFQKQLKRFGRFGVVMSFLVLPVICMPSTDMPDLEKSMEKAHLGEDNSAKFMPKGNAEIQFQARICGMIRDAVRLGYI
ncbi:uncharacterized protein LOC129743584 [Uranotaenia lowii]|uniref:uncharacterized protein LOC129743584 n=1 Tax=Uranotaenia lowii TaxID=190385 RepID=UPI00247B2B38|nr:uncharacterized protein LOC129743584 [Uranotaenia lowii]